MTRLSVVCCTLLLISGCSAGDDAFKRDLANSFRRIADVIEEELRGPPVKPPVTPPVDPPPYDPVEHYEDDPPVEVVPPTNVGVTDGDELPGVVEVLIGNVGAADDPGVPPPDSDDGDTSAPPPNLASSPSADQPVFWETLEYKNSKGLRLINASEGHAHAVTWVRPQYSTGKLGGDGITVMVIDNGVDLSHPEFRNYFRPGDDSGAGVRFHEEYSLSGDELSYSHGTPVAGVIAARKDGFGMHGVAYDARIVSMGRCFPDDGCARSVPDASGDQVRASHIASAAGLNRTYTRQTHAGFLGIGDRYLRMHSNPDAESDIINMSFVGDGNNGFIASAMRDAASENKVMVAALGNYGAIGPTGSPASNVADPGVAGYAIAVGALNSKGDDAAEWSNRCGHVAYYCLFAPGSLIFTTSVDGPYDADGNYVGSGGGYIYANGTSFAAPHVSGAAAVVWAVFPFQSARNILDRLLFTARPVNAEHAAAWAAAAARGEYYVDPTFGWGALDLGTALAPVNRGRGLVIGGSLVPVADSYVTLPPGFAAPATGSHGLANTIVYDGMMFPFYYDLAASFRASDSSADGMLRDFLSELGTSSNVSLGGADASLYFVHDDEVAERRWDTLEEDDEDEELDVYRFSLTPAPGVKVTLGQGFGSTGSSNGFIAARTNRSIFGDALSVAPFAALAGRGPGVTVGWQVDHDTTIDLVGKDGRGYSGSSSAQLASLGLTREIADGVTLGTRYGTLREKGSLMGIRTAGAFANEGQATTDFVDVSMEGQVSDDLTLFGSVSQGITGGGTRGAKNSLVSEGSATRAGSFVIGTEFEHLLQDSDRLTVTASSPFRADRATVHLDVPDREVADQVVAYSQRSVDLVPSGREHRLQWVYEMKPGASWLGFDRDAVSLAIGSYLRMEAGHDETADPEYGAAAKIRASF